jgi:hypothetical protein
MASEVRITGSLQVRKGVTQYGPSQPGSVQANMTGTRGPTPGAVLVATGAGTDINLSELDLPGGWARVMNLDPGVGTGTVTDNYIAIGIKSGGTFYPFCWLLPGEDMKVRFIPTWIGLVGTYHAVAAHATTQLLVEAFDF